MFFLRYWLTWVVAAVVVVMNGCVAVQRIPSHCFCHSSSAESGVSVDCLLQGPHGSVSVELVSQLMRLFC